jgi:HEAT repeat protein
VLPGTTASAGVALPAGLVSEVLVGVELIGLAVGKEPWFWEITTAVVAVLVFLNVLVLVAVHGRRIRQAARTRRAKRFRKEFERVLAELDAQAGVRDTDWLRAQTSGFDELERPIAAAMLIERVRPMSDEERERTLEALREIDAIPRIVHATRGWMPWRRALACRTLGWIGADEAVPALLERVDDGSRGVREAAVRALGRIGDRRALAPLGELLRSPGSVGSGVVYDALIAFGLAAEPLFAGALGSQDESVRVSGCFGVAALSEPETARSRVAPLLADASAHVRAAAAKSLAQLGGAALPEGLARASRDEEPTVRAAAVVALGSFDDPRAVEFVLNALLDPDRDTVIRAGESLVRLSRGAAAGPVASEALERSRSDWPVERALTFAELGAV